VRQVRWRCILRNVVQERGTDGQAGGAELRYLAFEGRFKGIAGNDIALQGIDGGNDGTDSGDEYGAV